MDSLVKGIIRRNEILTLLSTLQAAGLDLGQLLRYMAPIVYEILDEKAKGDLEAEREMVLLRVCLSKFETPETVFIVIFELSGVENPYKQQFPLSLKNLRF